jgi:cell wall-associated NlpC family hydrolase
MIAEEALSWRDTPFVWGQSQKGVGCDCKGLVAGVARELGRPEADSFYALFANYRVDRPVPSDLLLEGMAALFDQVQHMGRDDVLLCNHQGHPAHMAIYLGDGRAIHAWHGLNAKVRDRDVGVLFHKFPLHSVWRWRT